MFCAVRTVEGEAGFSPPTTRAKTRFMAPFRLRSVTRDDVPRVLPLVREVLAEYGLTFGEGSATDAQLAELPASYTDHGGAFWVAEAPSESDDRGYLLLGTAGVFPLEPGVFELRKMYLSPASRGRGVGRALLDEACAFCRRAGGKTLVLDTIEEMTQAIRFYEAAGFVRDDAQVRGARCSRGYAKEL